MEADGTICGWKAYRVFHPVLQEEYRELITYERAVLTSFHSSGSTINVLQAGEATPRKIRRCLITQFNHLKVYF